MPLTFFQQKAQFEQEAYEYFDQNIRNIPKDNNGEFIINSSTASNNDVDAFRHAYVSARFTQEYGENFSDLLGLTNELVHKNEPSERNMDLWNNALGREYATDAESAEEIGSLLKTALNSNALITNPNDSRKFPGGDEVDTSDFLNAIGNLGSNLARSVMDYANQLRTALYPEIPFNAIIATDGDNLLVGTNDQANTYYIPELNGHCIINDPANTGIVKIGRPPVTIQGNAIPVKDAAGNIIPGRWTLNGYDLYQSGDNLLIVPAGADPSSPDTPSVTVNNFPFNAPGVAFGLTLGKVKTDQYDLTSKTGVTLRDSALYAMNDPNGAFITSALRTVASGNQLLRVVICDSEGNIVSEIPLDNNGDYSIDPLAAYSANNDGKNIKILAAFSNPGETVGVALIEASTGEVLGRQILDSSSGVNQDGHPFAVNFGSYPCFYFGNDGTNFYVHASRTDLVNAKLEARMLKFNKHTLALVESIVPQPGQIQNGVFGGHQSINISPPEIKLANDVYVRRNNNELTFRNPVLANMTLADIPSDNRVKAGTDVEAQLTDGQGVITFEEPEAGQKKGAAVIPSGHVRAIVRGPGQVSLDNLDVEADQIFASIQSVSVDQFSDRNLFEGEYNPDARRRKDLADDLQELRSSNGAETYAMLSMIGINNNGEHFDVRLFYPEKNATDLQNDLEGYFIDYEDFSTRTVSSTTTTTFEPTSSSTTFYDPTTLGLTSTTTARQIGGGNNTNVNDAASSGGGIPIAAIALPPVAGTIGLFGLGKYYWDKWRKKNGDETRRRQREEHDTRRQARAEEGRAGARDNGSWTDETDEALQRQTVGLQAFEEADVPEQDGYLVVRAPDSNSQTVTPPSPRSIRKLDSEKLEEQEDEKTKRTETRF